MTQFLPSLNLYLIVLGMNPPLGKETTRTTPDGWKKVTEANFQNYYDAPQFQLLFPSAVCLELSRITCRPMGLNSYI